MTVDKVLSIHWSTQHSYDWPTVAHGLLAMHVGEYAVNNKTHQLSCGNRFQYGLAWVSDPPPWHNYWYLAVFNFQNLDVAAIGQFITIAGSEATDRKFASEYVCEIMQQHEYKSSFALLATAEHELVKWKSLQMATTTCICSKYENKEILRGNWGW